MAHRVSFTTGKLGTFSVDVASAAPDCRCLKTHPSWSSLAHAGSRTPAGFFGRGDLADLPFVEFSPGCRSWDPGPTRSCRRTSPLLLSVSAGADQYCQRRA